MRALAPVSARSGDANLYGVLRPAYLSGAIPAPVRRTTVPGLTDTQACLVTAAEHLADAIQKSSEGKAGVVATTTEHRKALLEVLAALEAIKRIAA